MKRHDLPPTVASAYDPRIARWETPSMMLRSEAQTMAVAPGAARRRSVSRLSRVLAAVIALVR